MPFSPEGARDERLHQNPEMYEWNVAARLHQFQNAVQFKLWNSPLGLLLWTKNGHHGLLEIPKCCHTNLKTVLCPVMARDCSQFYHRGTESDCKNSRNHNTRSSQIDCWWEQTHYSSLQGCFIGHYGMEPRIWPRHHMHLHPSREAAAAAAALRDNGAADKVINSFKCPYPLWADGSRWARGAAGSRVTHLHLRRASSLQTASYTFSLVRLSPKLWTLVAAQMPSRPAEGWLIQWRLHSLSSASILRL